MTVKDTTQPGVSDVELDGLDTDTQVPQEEPRTARNNALEEIAARRADELSGQQEEPPEEGEEEQQVAQQEASATNSQPTGPVFEQEGVWMTRVKVNGKEEDVPLEQVTARYQKDAAGDEKLRIAAERERQLAEMEQRLRDEQAQILSLKEQQRQPSQESEDVERLRVDEKDLVTALLDGDEDQFAEKMKAYRQSIKEEVLGELRDVPASTQATITPEQIALEVEDRIRMNTAIASFEDEYQDVVADPELRNMVSRKVQEIQQADPSQPYDAILRQAGEGVRGWISEKTGKPAASNQSSDREQRKRTATAATVSANARASLGEDVPPPASGSQIIAEMRKARGQPV